MLSGLLFFVSVFPVALAMDWLAATRIAAYRTDYEYTYRPGVARYAILAVAAAVTAYMRATYDPERQPIIGLLILGGLMLAWGYFGLRDVELGLVPSDLAPKRYADTDY